MTTTRRLVLVRHARAESAATDDLARPLTAAGRADAAEAGRWLAARGVTPEHALVSSAVRARSTWEELATAAGWSVSVVEEPGLHTAGPDSALDLIRLAPPAAGTVVVVGHNPTVASLVQLLDDGNGEPEVAGAMIGGFPPCALAVLDHAGAWTDLDTATATAVDFHVGRA